VSAVSVTSGKIAERARARWAAAGLEPITLHECRHTYASFLMAAGYTLRELMEYMGHSSLQATERYVKLLPPLDETDPAEGSSPRPAKTTPERCSQRGTRRSFAFGTDDDCCHGLVGVPPHRYTICGLRLSEPVPPRRMSSRRARTVTGRARRASRCADRAGRSRRS